MKFQIGLLRSKSQIRHKLLVTMVPWSQSNNLWTTPTTDRANRVYRKSLILTLLFVNKCKVMQLDVFICPVSELRGVFWVYHYRNCLYVCNGMKMYNYPSISLISWLLNSLYWTLKSKLPEASHVIRSTCLTRRITNVPTTNLISFCPCRSNRTIPFCTNWDGGGREGV